MLKWYQIDQIIEILNIRVYYERYDEIQRIFWFGALQR